MAAATVGSATEVATAPAPTPAPAAPTMPPSVSKRAKPRAVRHQDALAAAAAVDIEMMFAHLLPIFDNRVTAEAGKRGHGMSLAITEPQRRPCFTCCKPNATQQCSKCQRAQYCDHTCQLKHWIAAHSGECGAVYVSAMFPFALRLQANQQMCLVAVRTIEPGETVLVEESFLAIHLDDHVPMRQSKDDATTGIRRPRRDASNEEITLAFLDKLQSFEEAERNRALDFLSILHPRAAESTSIPVTGPLSVMQDLRQLMRTHNILAHDAVKLAKFSRFHLKFSRNKFLSNPAGAWSMYLFASLINHSCMANAMFRSETTEKGTPFLHLRALDRILAGQEITIRYATTVNNQELRKEHIFSVLDGIHCTCRACRQNLVVTNNVSQALIGKFCFWCSRLLDDDDNAAITTTTATNGCPIRLGERGSWFCSLSCKKRCEIMPDFVSPPPSSSSLPAAAAANPQRSLTHTEKQLDAQLFSLETRYCIEPMLISSVLPALEANQCRLLSLD